MCTVITVWVSVHPSVHPSVSSHNSKTAWYILINLCILIHFNDEILVCGHILFLNLMTSKEVGTSTHYLALLPTGELTRIVRESDYSPAAALFMQEKCQVLKIFSRKIYRYLAGTNSDINQGPKLCYKLDLVNMNAYIKFDDILSICSQVIEMKRNFGINQGP